MQKSGNRPRNRPEKWSSNTKKPVSVPSLTRCYAYQLYADSLNTVSVLRQQLAERDAELQHLRDSHIADIRQLTAQYTVQRDTQIAERDIRITELQDESSTALRNLRDELNDRHSSEIL